MGGGYRVMDTDELEHIVAIVGPTASGKSTLAILLANEFEAEIVNADVFSCYKHLDIATAKPLASERNKVPHHLFDVWEIEKEANVAEYQGMARAAIANIQRRGKRVIIVGGSGLYVASILTNLVFPETDNDVRQRLYDECERNGLHVMYKRLALLDPMAAKNIEPENERRIIRALEVIELTKRPFRSKLVRDQFVYKCVWLGLDLERSVLDERITQRVAEMFRKGLKDEVKRYEKRLRDSMTASRAIGYKELLAESLKTDDEYIAQIIQNTKRLARRQMSWFRKYKVNWTQLMNAEEQYIWMHTQIMERTSWKPVA